MCAYSVCHVKLVAFRQDLPLLPMDGLETPWAEGKEVDYRKHLRTVKALFANSPDAEGAATHMFRRLGAMLLQKLGYAERHAHD